MERWSVLDTTALELIEFPGKLAASGKRPKFKFTTHQLRITAYLPEIDALLSATGKDQSWLHRQVPVAPFSGRTPIEHMVAYRTAGMADVLLHLTRIAMRAALVKR
jgi:hypothetical protein